VADWAAVDHAYIDGGAELRVVRLLFGPGRLHERKDAHQEDISLAQDLSLIDLYILVSMIPASRGEGGGGD
jgi:hypothetical protein